ncbi:MAG: class I SAM-dependent methyltransferase [Brumimicrobium sp.]
MEVKNIMKAQGHWLLAKMGKKVLRPGGKELTERLVENLKITENDKVIEFAPGIGFTANLTLHKNPASYIGVDADEEAVELLNNKFFNLNPKPKFINGKAENTGLEDQSATKVYGEALLTMHADHRKELIIKEAHRLLETGGLYAIHEIALTPNKISDELKAKIQKDLALSILVNARPLTTDEWTQLLNNAGFDVVYQSLNGMFLLKFSRMIDDEGFWNTLKIAGNILKSRAATKRILQMYKVFTKHQKYMQSIVIVARKR